MTHTVIKCLISFTKNNNIIKMNTCKRNNQDCLLCSDEYAKQEFLCKNEPLSGYIIVKNPYRNLVHYPMDYLPSRLIKCNHCNSNIVDLYAEGVRDVNNVQATMITSFET